MARFKESISKEVPAINSSSMSDIIFMLLFFFMVTTTLKDTTLLVKVNVPAVSEVQKLEKKSLVSSIYVGKPLKAIYGTESRIQLNDQFAEVSDIPEFIALEREQRNEYDRKFLTTSIKADQLSRMGLVTDIKQELRKVGAFKINYSARRTDAIN